MSTGAVRVADLTPEAPPEAVLRLASYLVRNVPGFGALERNDCRSIAVLAFYEVRERWKGAGCFGSYALRCMEGAIQQAVRREARQQTGLPRTALAGSSSKDVHRHKTPAPSGRVAIPAMSDPGGGAASFPTLAAHTRRLVSQREYNRTYFYRTVGLQACASCGALVERGHGARHCAACIRGTPADRNRGYRLGVLRPCGCGCGTVGVGPYRRGHARRPPREVAA